MVNQRNAFRFFCLQRPLLRGRSSPPKLHVRLPSSLLPLASALLPRTVFRVVDRWFRCRNSRRAGEVAAWRVWPLLLKIPARARQYLWYLILERYFYDDVLPHEFIKIFDAGGDEAKGDEECDTLEICVQTNMSAAAREVQASPRKDATRVARSSTLYFFSFRCGHDQDVCRHLETNGSSHSWPDSFVDSNFTRRKHSTSPLLRFLSRHNISNYHHRRTANRKLKKPTR